MYEHIKLGGMSNPQEYNLQSSAPFKLHLAEGMSIRQRFRISIRNTKLNTGLHIKFSAIYTVYIKKPLAEFG